MSMSLAAMVEEVLLHAGRSMTVRQLTGAIRTMFAVAPTRRALRRACYTDAALKRDGSGAYRLDLDLRADRLWRELDAVA